MMHSNTCNALVDSNFHIHIQSLRLNYEITHKINKNLVDHKIKIGNKKNNNNITYDYNYIIILYDFSMRS